MKKLLILTAMVAACIYATAQKEHLDFCGIPIDGTIEEFIPKMEENYFSLMQQEEYFAAFIGKYQGRRMCFVSVVAHEDINRIMMVMVTLPSRSNWAELMSDYDQINANIAEMTGKKGVENHVWEKSKNPSTDEERWKLLGKKKCRYSTVYNLDNGAITVEVDHNGAVDVTYEDHVNRDLWIMKDIHRKS